MIRPARPEDVPATAAAARRDAIERTLCVLEDNVFARRFYEKHSFRTDGGRKSGNRTGFPLHGVRYRRTLRGNPAG